MKENLHVGTHINSHPNYDNIKMTGCRECKFTGEVMLRYGTWVECKCRKEHVRIGGNFAKTNVKE